MKVLCFGSLNLDYVYAVDHIVRLGETEDSAGLSVNCGGKGLNQSIAIARAGFPVWHAGLVGEDGAELVAQCVRNGVNTDFVRTVEGRSGHTIIQVDKDGNNSIVLFGGANRRMTREFIREVIGAFREGDMIILQNEINLLPEIIDEAYEQGMKIVLNPSPYSDNLRECDLGKVSYFFLNEIEGEQMTGEREPERILPAIHEMYKKAKVVLTLGEDGAMYSDGQVICRQEAFRVKAVDTTAAGDTFSGYFVSALIRGMMPQEGLALAARAAAMAVTKPGALDSIPTLAEVQSATEKEETSC